MRRLARNVATNYLVYAASIVSGLVLTPIIIGAIGVEAFGVWAFILSATVVLRILDFGIAPTVVRHAAFHGGRDDRRATSELASVGLLLYLGIGAIVVAVGLVLAWFVPSLVEMPADLRDPARVAAFLAVLTLGTELPLGLFGSLLKGRQRFDLLNLAALVSLAVYALLVVVVLTQRETLPALAAIALVATVVRLAIPVLFVRRVVPGLRLSPSLVSRARVGELLAFSGYAFLGHLAAKVVFSADLILVGIVLDAEAVAQYAVASRLFGVGRALSATGTDVLFPTFAELEGRAEDERQRRLLLTALRGGICVTVLVAAPLVVLPDRVLEAWLGEGYGPAEPTLALLGLTLLCSVPVGIFAQFLLARGRPRALAVSQVVLGAANLAATVTLLATVGEVWTAAAVTLALEALAALVVLPYLLRDSFPARALLGAWARPVALGAAAAVPVLFVLGRALPTERLLVLALVGLLWTAVYAPLAWALALTPDERRVARRTAGLLRRPRLAEAEVDEGQLSA